MIRIKSFFSILVFIILLINKVYAQENSFNKQLEFEFNIMNESNDSVRNHLILEKGVYLKKQANYLLAQKTLLRINDSYLPDSLKAILSYHTIFCLYMSSKYKDAMYELPNLQQYKFRFYTKDMYLLELLVLSINHKTNAFQYAFMTYAKLINFNDTLGLKTYSFEKNEEVEPSKTNLGKVFPGIDLINNGLKKQGFVNVGLMSLSLGNFVFQSITGMYSFAICTGIYPLLKFKLGGKILLAHLPYNNQQKRISNDVVFMQNEIQRLMGR